MIKFEWRGHMCVALGLAVGATAEIDGSWVACPSLPPATRTMELHATEAGARAAVEAAVSAAIGDQRFPDWLTEHGVKLTEEGHRLREAQLTECLHFENAMAAAFDPPDDCRSLAAWIIDNFAPPGAEARMGEFLRQWLAKERAKK